MLITIKVPDNAVRIMYTQLYQDGIHETETRQVTAGMIMRVENENAGEPIRLRCNSIEFARIQKQEGTHEPEGR